jgi:SPW repeat
MAAANKITDHEWQDLVCMGLGVLTLLSPWVVPNDDMGAMTVNTVFVGLCVLVVSEIELAGHTAREEAVNATAGLWLMLSPFVFGYGGELRLWHLVLGALVVVFAAVEFWQERRVPRRARR